MVVKLQLNEIKSERMAQGVCSETFLQWAREAESSYENLRKSPKSH